MMKLDAWDKKILTLLQRNNRLSQREIADRISLSPSQSIGVSLHWRMQE